MMQSPLAYIVILNWNGWKDTVECVGSCFKLTYDNFRIVVVDNGSSDGSESILRARFPDIELLQTNTNLGFAGGNNAGIRHAMDHAADYVWLLNNDTVVDPFALTALVEAAEQDHRAGMAGSKIFTFDEPGRLWFAGGFWKYGKLLLQVRGLYEKDTGAFDSTSEVDFLTGCSLLIRASTVRDIGLLDEDYFLYWEDTDWSARALEHTWKILYVPKSKVWHKVSASFNPVTDEQAYYYLRNKLLFYARHAPAALPIALCLSFMGALRHILQGKTNFARGYLSGMIDFMRRRFGKRTTSGNKHDHGAH